MDRLIRIYVSSRQTGTSLKCTHVVVLIVAEIPGVEVPPSRLTVYTWYPCVLAQSITIN